MVVKQDVDAMHAAFGVYLVKNVSGLGKAAPSSLTFSESLAKYFDQPLAVVTRFALGDAPMYLLSYGDASDCVLSFAVFTGASSRFVKGGPSSTESICLDVRLTPDIDMYKLLADGKILSPGANNATALTAYYAALASQISNPVGDHRIDSIKRFNPRIGHVPNMITKCIQIFDAVNKVEFGNKTYIFYCSLDGSFLNFHVSEIVSRMLGGVSENIFAQGMEISLSGDGLSVRIDNIENRQSVYHVDYEKILQGNIFPGLTEKIKVLILTKGARRPDLVVRAALIIIENRLDRLLFI
jgi:hypothetical protein